LGKENTVVEEKINELKKRLVDYTSIVMGMVEKSIKGLTERKEEVLTDLIKHDEPKANDFEIELDDMCTTLIVQLQPKAVDLRTILMILKMDNDLERIADHAVNIAQSAQYLIELPLVKLLIDIPRMAKDVTKMLNDSITSFISENAHLAKSVCERDSIIDALRDQILRELITYMISDPTTIERSLHLLNITKNLERIADLSTNICEEVIYLVEGRVIKHHKEE
jgi:phosphate transport system protein